MAKGYNFFDFNIIFNYTKKIKSHVKKLYIIINHSLNITIVNLEAIK